MWRISKAEAPNVFAGLVFSEDQPLPPVKPRGRNREAPLNLEAEHIVEGDI